MTGPKLCALPDRLRGRAAVADSGCAAAAGAQVDAQERLRDGAGPGHDADEGKLPALWVRFNVCGHLKMAAIVC